MLKRFWNQPYNAPTYKTYEKDLALMDAVYGIASGKLEEYSKGKVFHNN